MRNNNKTKKQLIGELLSLRQRIAKLEKFGAEWKQAAAEPQQKSEHFRLLVESVKDYAIIMLNPEGHVATWNTGAERIKGYRAEEIIGKHFSCFYTSEDIQSGKPEHELKVAATEGRIEDEGWRVRKDGSRFWANAVTTALRDEAGDLRGFAQVTRNMTERKHAEELFRSLATNSPVGVYIVQKGEFCYTNPQFQEDTGYREDELLGMESLSLVIPEDRGTVRENAVQMLKGKRTTPYEYRIVNKSGETRWALETVAPIQYQGEQATIGSYQDVTERKRMEEQLIITDRLASIGELASGIAHELNNPLTSIIGFADLLLGRDLPKDIKEDLQVMHKEAHRTAQVVRNLLTFARKHAPAKQPVNINKVIQTVLAVRAYEQRVNNIQVNTRFAPDLPEAMADGFQLQQAFINIIVNAEYFMVEAHGRGTLTITTEPAGDMVRAILADDGPGITEENLGHIFDPFFTTKEVGKGTGLGLSICHGIITEHGGRIYAESELGKGATFIVEIPISRQ